MIHPDKNQRHKPEHFGQSRTVTSHHFIRQFSCTILRIILNFCKSENYLPNYNSTLGLRFNYQGKGKAVIILKT